MVANFSILTSFCQKIVWARKLPFGTKTQHLNTLVFKRSLFTACLSSKAWKHKVFIYAVVRIENKNMLTPERTHCKIQFLRTIKSYFKQVSMHRYTHRERQTDWWSFLTDQLTITTKIIYLHPIGYFNQWKITDKIFLIKKRDEKCQTLEK